VSDDKGVSGHVLLDGADEGGENKAPSARYPTGSIGRALSFLTVLVCLVPEDSRIPED
jgi:hypothetical protein